MPLIEAVNLYQRHGKMETLKDLNLAIEKGEVVALIGPTGAGKTTALRLLNLLESPSEGHVLFDGTAISSSRKLPLKTRRKMAMVLQKPVAFNMNVYQNVAYSLSIRGYSRKRISDKVNKILAEVGLEGYEKRNALTLSGGEMQRVAIARAMITEPEVLLLDEPTANLDPMNTSVIEELILHFNRAYQTAIVMATHDLSQGQRLAHRIGVLMDGRLVQIGRPGEIFERPGSEMLAEFVGVENILKGVITSNEDDAICVDVENGFIEAISASKTGDPVSLCIRPEDITLALSAPSTSARNTLAGDVRLLASSGPMARVELDCGFPLVALITKRSAEEMSLGIGKKVFASFKATAVHVIRA